MGAKESQMESFYPERLNSVGSHNVNARDNISHLNQSYTQLFPPKMKFAHENLFSKNNANLEARLEKNQGFGDVVDQKSAVHKILTGDSITSTLHSSKETDFKKVNRDKHLTIYANKDIKERNSTLNKSEDLMVSKQYFDISPDTIDSDVSSSESLVSAQTVLDRFTARSKIRSNPMNAGQKIDLYISSTNPSSKSALKAAIPGTILNNSPKSTVGQDEEKTSTVGTDYHIDADKFWINNTTYSVNSKVNCEGNRDAESCITEFSEDLSKINQISQETSSNLGYQTSSCGDVVFTAYIRITGEVSNSWKELVKRSHRSLRGLQRQFQCKIQLHEIPFTFRATSVHKISITGTTFRDVLRCKNALPQYFLKLMITSHERCEDSFTRYARRR